MSAKTSDIVDRAPQKQTYRQNLSEKSRKVPLLFKIGANVRFFDALHSHVRKAESHVTFRTVIAHGI